MAKNRGAAAPSIFCVAKPNPKTPVKTSLLIDSPLVEHVGNFRDMVSGGELQHF